MKVYSFSLIFVENAIELARHYNFIYTESIDFDDNETYIIFGAHDQNYSYKLLLYKYKNKKDYIVINSEQPSSVLFNNKYYQQLLKVSRVADYNSLSVDIINKTVNSSAKCCYFFDFPINVPKDNKEYDIVFVGSRNATRENVFKYLKNKYPDKNILVDFGYNYTDINKLTKLLTSTKIVLNIPFYSDGILEIHRINKALSCGCTVVSTRGKDEYVNKLYEDYIHFTDDLLNFDYDKVDSKLSYNNLKSLFYKKYTFDFLQIVNKYIIVINAISPDDPASIKILNSIPSNISIILVTQGVDNITLIKNNIINLAVPHNSIDFTGIIAILENNFLQEKLVNSILFYTHATTEFGLNFFNLFKPESTQMLTRKPSMNIGTYEYNKLQSIKSFILNFKSSDYPSNEEILELKLNAIKQEDIIFTILKVDNVYCEKNKIKIKYPSDVYNTGTQRITEYYTTLDFYKFKANWGQFTESPILTV
jgi:hypothetical protein